jgi:hypothetical protein
MSSQNTNQSVKINGCAFCRSKNLPWVNHTISNCRNLKKNKCEYCSFTGHAVSRCQTKIEDNRKKFEQKELERRQRWEENQRLKEEEKVRKEAENAKKWSTIATKNISGDMSKKIAEENQISKEKERKRIASEKIKKAQEAKEIRERWEQNYPYRMSKKYGIKEDFYYDVHNPETILAYKGDFWEFHVENTRDDHEIARKAREEYKLASKFTNYLKEKYWGNWLAITEHTEDDCKYLWNLRQEEEEEEYKAEILREKRDREREEEEEKIKKEMKNKLKKGEISKREYDNWEEEENDYLESAFEHDGLRWYDSYERNNMLYEQWQYRDAARRGDTGFLQRKEEQKKKEKESMKVLAAQMEAESAYFKKKN